MIKIIAVTALRVGMYISEENARWVPSRNKSRSGMLTHQGTIDKIRRLGISEVFIDTERGLDGPEARQPTAEELAAVRGETATEGFANTSGVEVRPEAEPEAVIARQQEQSGVAAPSVTLATERVQAGEVHSRGLQLVDSVMERVRAGETIDISEVDDVADSIMGSLFRNENGFACLARIREKDAYLLEHSLNVGVLLGLLGKSLHYDQDVIRKLIAGGMLHDIGKILVPDAILNKPGKLDPEEWEEMKRHVDYGYEYLRSLGDIDPIVLCICRQHHERLNGAGYPLGLDSTELDHYARMAAVCDVYDAITADRVYHKGVSPAVAMRRLVDLTEHDLDKEMVYQLIRCLSIYPVGSVVALKSGRIGVVVSSNRIKQKSPVVRLMYDPERGQRLGAEDLDLAEPYAGDSILEVLEASALPKDINVLEFL
ncbi:HD-GYP domain-containing protein [Natronospirillum operosum]|uniref:HD-GYP domain-containing protein n=1 Tax=Natronospirillum operosum TaxID=2759953 RepID=A0A4Z0WAS2_9GAMM|nr:HD-GYP domain-containing protein [Natronospirillum operosum]TGG95749.1 HD-GYP domain-containing protein [Natronospirillum operosum]